MWQESQTQQQATKTSTWLSYHFAHLASKPIAPRDSFRANKIRLRPSTRIELLGNNLVQTPSRRCRTHFSLHTVYAATCYSGSPCSKLDQRLKALSTPQNYKYREQCCSAVATFTQKLGRCVLKVYRTFHVQRLL